MRILLLTQILPYPPDAGPRIKTWHVLRYLVEQGHQVTLGSFVRPDEEQYIPVLEQMCEKVATVPIRRSRPADIWYWLRSHVTGRPFLVERDDVAQMHAKVAGLIAEGNFEIVHVDQLTMAQYAILPNRTNAQPFRVFDAHNATWTILERMQHNASMLLKPVLGLEMNRIKNYEGTIIKQFDHTLAVTDIDRRALLDAANRYEPRTLVAPDRISVIPIAVDTIKLQPVRRAPEPNHILTLGTLHYAPNADGIRWFVRQVLPLIQQTLPHVKLTIIGKNPPPDFVQLAEQFPESITVTGYVPDLTPYMERAAVVVVPVLAGSGMRVRILECLSRALPVVTTSVGLEGIEARSGDEVLVADTPGEFASAVVRTLADSGLQNHMATNGRRLAETRYDWRVVLKKMDVVYQAARREMAIPAV